MQPAAGQHVHVQVKDTLTRVGSCVHNEPKSPRGNAL